MGANTAYTRFVHLQYFLDGSKTQASEDCAISCTWTHFQIDPPAYLEMLQQAVGDTDQASLAGVMKIRTHSLKHLAKIITDDYEMGWGIII